MQTDLGYDTVLNLEKNPVGVNAGVWAVSLAALRDVTKDRADVESFIDEMKNCTAAERPGLTQEFLTSRLPEAVKRAVKLMQVVLLFLLVISCVRPFVVACFYIICLLAQADLLYNVLLAYFVLALFVLDLFLMSMF